MDASDGHNGKQPYGQSEINQSISQSIKTHFIAPYVASESEARDDGN